MKTLKTLRSLPVVLIACFAAVGCVGCSSQAAKDAVLYQAAVTGDVPAAQGVLSDGAHFDAPRPSEGWTPLMEASGSGNPEMVTFLLEQHANINYADPKMGYTALHAAADVGGRDRVGVVRVLLAHGATLSIRDKKGQTPLDIARKIQGHYSRSLKYMPAGREYREANAVVALLDKAK